MEIRGWTAGAIADKPANDSFIHVLCVEDTPNDASIIARYLAVTAATSIHVECVPRLADAIHRLQFGKIDVVLLDLALPDSTGLATLEAVLNVPCSVPIVVLTGTDDIDLALTAIKMGAQDYLVKGEFEQGVLSRAVRYAIERAKLKSSLQESERRYRRVIDRADDAIFFINVEGDVVDVNETACRRLGYERQELSYVDFAAIDSECHKAKLRTLMETLKSCGSTTIESVHRCSDGTTVPVEVKYGLIENDSELYVLAVARDITHRVWRLQAEKILRSNAEELENARDIQRMIFPSGAPDIRGFDVSGASIAAAQTSGDYFDFIPMKDGYTGVAVGDVSGHGFGPAILSGQMHAYLRVLSSLSSDVRDILTRANKFVSVDTGEVRFVALSFVRLQPGKPSLVYAGAGQRAFLVRESGELVTLEATGLPVGVDRRAEIGTGPSLELLRGDTLVLFTDGLIEAVGHNEQQFGVSRALDVVRANRRKSSREIKRALFVAVRDFCQNFPQHDDITVVVVKPKAECFS